jgi:DNA (cytosine-5)-methyltransferase 1
MDRELTHFSLFSGSGAVDLAGEWAGFKTVGMCEKDEFCREILGLRFPGVPIWEDVKDVTNESVCNAGIGRINLLTASFPCQPFSVAGQRRGADDDRFLWPETCRIVSEIRPAWFVGENVNGLVSMGEPNSLVRVESRKYTRFPEEDFYEAIYTQQERMLLHSICKDIENIGYSVQPFVIPACSVGASNERYRIFIVANSKNREQS